ncbi:MAG TPA: molybdate ABC transporter substrate-binding protein [Sulfurovum sp.]|jgi:molybdate transport system substrate-binding protein|nr:MAG: molybdate ABC transporter substrate-binding protein [Sulfurovum sp. 35-42-20]OYZ25296.1 MAG: molybdate ABC transporter substrate-binding protein [Sulfurovum sp. 16-42-52]OYZ48499.1 MAG: molybdate ABC transporter substrate-binding protein [Sulfurovum sp. 24-42-9]OZA44171.1 MAG: molybdate ABC transporter substrate-binding protein [Sulfurovum sp. 17-42-90]OZA61303.1 MAG: molybdate ABC transporter substrate-binding protein [Sulfurovum sp. 39-42-12]HQR74744.1 molybdate ABC transporter subst
MKKSALVALLFLTTYNMAGSVNIALAANVADAMVELKKEFALVQPDTKLNVTLGSSGKLTAQIKNGAPYALFLSADMNFPQALYKEGIAVTKPVVYAQGALAYISKTPQDFTQGIALVKNDTIGKIAVANPKTAPYGTAALEAMKHAGVYDEVKEKLVFAESISQTVVYAVTAADIGFIAKSSLYSPNMSQYKEDTHWAEVDPSLYSPINQGIVLLKAGEQNQEAKALYDFILSAKGKEILKKFGYLVP